MSEKIHSDAVTQPSAVQALEALSQANCHASDFFLSDLHYTHTEPFLPNLSITLRDKAHASRRILARPWACDEYLQTIAGTLISERWPVAQLIQSSFDHRTWFEEALVIRNPEMVV